MNEIFSKTIVKTKQPPKDHHFVPKTYIKRFYNDKNKVWRGDLKNNRVKDFTATQIFYEHFLHNITYKGEKYLEIENNYRDLEDLIGKLYTLLKEVRDFKLIEEDQEAKSNLFSILKIIVIFQYFRTKDIDPNIFLETCLNLTEIYKKRNKYFKEFTKYIKLNDLQLFEKILRKDVRKGRNENTYNTLKALQYSILPMLLSDFSNTEIRIKLFKSKCLITSDKPVVTKSEDNILKFRNFIYVFTPKILIYAYGDDVTEEMVNDHKLVNKFVKENAVSFIISHERNLLEKNMN